MTYEVIKKEIRGGEAKKNTICLTPNRKRLSTCKQ